MTDIANSASLQPTAFDALEAAIAALVGAVEHLPYGSRTLAQWRRTGLARLLTWLWPQPGDTWQQKWVAANADDVWHLVGGLSTPARSSANNEQSQASERNRYAINCWKAGLQSAIGLHLVQPGPTFVLYRVNAVRLNDLVSEHAHAISQVISAGSKDSAVSDSITYTARYALAAMLATTGKSLREITVDDWAIVESARKDLRRATSPDAPGGKSRDVLFSLAWAYRAAVAAQQIAPLTTPRPGRPDIPPTLALAMSKPRTLEAALQSYEDLLAGPLYDLILATLRLHYQHVDYGTLRTVVDSIVLYRRAIVAVEPSNRTFSVDVANIDQLMSTLRTKRIGATVVDRESLGHALSRIRIFNERAYQVALDSEKPEWLRVVNPFPFTDATVQRMMEKEKKQRSTNMFGRIRNRMVILPTLLEASSSYLRSAEELSAAAVQTAEGDSFEHHGTIYTRRTPKLTDTSAHATARERLGLLVKSTTAVSGVYFIDLEVLKNRALRAHAFVATARHTGLRLEEILELTRDSITTSDIYGNPVTALNTSPSKLDTSRTIPLHKEAVAALVALIEDLKRHNGGRMPLAYRYDRIENLVLPAKPYLFQQPGTGTNIVSADYAVYTWLKAVIAHHNKYNADLSKLAHMKPHDFRRLFCTDLLERGTPIQSVALLMGHERLSTTQIYDHTDRQDAMRDFREAQQAARTRSGQNSCPCCNGTGRLRNNGHRHTSSPSSDEEV